MDLTFLNKYLHGHLDVNFSDEQQIAEANSGLQSSSHAVSFMINMLELSPLKLHNLIELSDSGILYQLIWGTLIILPGSKLGEIRIFLSNLTIRMQKLHRHSEHPQVAVGLCSIWLTAAKNNHWHSLGNVGSQGNSYLLQQDGVGHSRASVGLPRCKLWL